MKLFVTLLWLGFAALAFGEGEFAVVRVTDIYRELPSTAAMQEKIKAQRAEIIENQRAEQLRSIIVELQSIQSQLQAITDQTDTEQGKKVVRAYEIKRQEAETLRQEFEEFRAEEEKRINKLMVAEMRKSLNEITAAASQLAKERSLDGVFDTSGNSNTGVPFVLYVKDAEDLTEDVVELLNAKEPQEEPSEGPAEVSPTENQEPQE